MTAPSIGAVVVHWRGMADTRECLESLAASAGDIRAAVVDNASADFDRCASDAAYAGVQVVRSETNAGYAGGCNAGARALAALDVSYLCFLNNDVAVDAGAVALLANALASRRAAAIAGPIVRYYDEPDLIWSAGGHLYSLGYTRHVAYRHRQAPAGADPVDFVNGCVLMVRRDAFDRAGGFDEEYFHYFEDADLCARVQALGHECVVVPEAVVRHKVSASAGTRGSDRLNREQAYYFARNRVRFLRRNWRGGRRALALAAQPGLVGYESAKALRAGNPAEARGRVAGLVAGLRGAAGPHRP